MTIATATTIAQDDSNDNDDDDDGSDAGMDDMDWQRRQKCKQTHPNQSGQPRLEQPLEVAREEHGLLSQLRHGRPVEQVQRRPQRRQRQH